MKRLAALPILLLTGCGGRQHSDAEGVSPLSPYATITLSNAVGFNGSTESYSFLVRSVLTDGTLVMDDPYGIGSGSTPKRVRIRIEGYSGKKGETYDLGDRAEVRIHDFGDGTADRVWVSTGGRIVDEGTHFFRRFRVEKATIVPVEGTGATGTATVSAEIDSALFL